MRRGVMKKRGRVKEERVPGGGEKVREKGNEGKRRGGGREMV